MTIADSAYDRVNDYGSVKINLASPNDIRSWSFGEVKKPETINYRTYRPERDGLFCERIFGPERDYECTCGKYKGTKYKGIICDRCGVKVTHSRVRRQRMGHINLAAPVVHIWFFKSMPSRLGNLLAMKTSDLEKVIYFQDWVVTDPGETKLKLREVLTEDEYKDAIATHGSHAFTAMMGAEAIRELLAPDRLDLAALADEVRTNLDTTKSVQRRKDFSKRLKIVEQLRQSENDPQWMVLDVVPVIPPDLRPLVLLDSGNFATSDLNDLYRRIINRNNRLKKLMDLNAPEVIVRNEKRMLQQAVDALFDNGRCRRPVIGSSNRPLKSITDMIKGKQGRFRENLLGKRVDYSARSVIVVGPKLKFWQCGLPKKIALELYQPFIIRKLKDRGLADTIKSAKRMLERREAEVWDILEEVIKNHPVLLNRAPTLHRMGIQAFEPVLVEGNAIMIHPLVCAGYNADFDGDQMAVHLPLSLEAQAEAHVLMLSIHNVFSPSSGAPIVSPSQDIIMGVYYLTAEPMEDVTPSKGIYRNIGEALMAYDHGRIGMHEPATVRLEHFTEVVTNETEPAKPLPANRRITTTIGRILFSEALGAGMPFYNCVLRKKGAARVIDDTFARLGKAATIDLLDRMKETGFKSSTLSGLSFAITDLRIPQGKDKLIADTEKRVAKIVRNYNDAHITNDERRNQIQDAWNKCRDELVKRLFETIKADRRIPSTGAPAQIADLGQSLPTGDGGRRYLNPVYLFMDSGARGNRNQLQQLAAMKGQISKPNGEIIEAPVKSNFREGLQVLEYFSSTHGTRKGLADTALKTADSGYLTRKLCDVAQSVVVSEDDCGTTMGISKRALYKGEDVDIPLRDVVKGRTSCDTIIDPRSDETIVAKGEMITVEASRRIESLGTPSVTVRSPLTCQSRRGVCAKCYGMDLSTGVLVEPGLAVGIIAAQSIGEPGTQLTMRTFHTGGIAFSSSTESQWKAPSAGIVRFLDCEDVPDPTDSSRRIALRKSGGEAHIVDDKGRPLEKFKVPNASSLLVADGARVRKGEPVVEWDPHVTPILAVKPGIVRFRDIAEGETVRREQRKGARTETVVTEHTGEKHPRIMIEDETGHILDLYHLPARARIEAEDGVPVLAGTRLAAIPKGAQRTADIVGGLPRVTEIFEARNPKDPAVMAKISGRVELLPNEKRGKMTIRIHPSSDKLEYEDHYVPQGQHLSHTTGDEVEAGPPLTDGSRVPQDVLAIQGEEALYRYMLEEVQNVYRAQSQAISDKHIEIILRQMVGKVRIQDVGDSKFLPNDIVDRTEFRLTNDKLIGGLLVEDPGDTSLEAGTIVPRSEAKAANALVEAEGKVGAKTRKAKPAKAKPLLLGITKASLQSESFLSGASFQETTKVLSEAALRGAVDPLEGLKENVLLGHLIPAGTGFSRYKDLRVRYLVEVPALAEADETASLLEAKKRAEQLDALRLGQGTTLGESGSLHHPVAVVAAGVDDFGNPLQLPADEPIER
ncbi:MAG: DNA-directed RNA polymerase subunit beta' [Planctomycetota bacterium]|nr:DNA-directed RNA polymerase subunit beta' [Planctomycetota bacterium]